MHRSEFISVGVLLAIILAVFILESCLLFIFLEARLHKAKCPATFFSKPALLIHALAVIGLLCLGYGFFIEPYRVELKKIEIMTDKLQCATLRLVQFSDIHCDKKPLNEGKLVEITNRIGPDIIVFTGDCLNSASGLPRFKRTLSELKAPLGKFAVYGNVDIAYRSRLDLFSDTGFKLLDGQTVSIEKNGETFYLAGFSVPAPDEFEKFLEPLPDDKFSILFYHYSDLVESLAGLNIDLYLSGHTHGGQIRLPFYGALITLSKFGKKYEAGMYTVGETIVYVNRGIGLEGGIAPRARFLCRPEITLFEIKPKNQNTKLAK